jgi:UDP-N-acetylmuramate dehydrogenase
MVIRNAVNLEDEIRKVEKGDVFTHEPLSRHTWYAIGGPADFYCVPADLDDLRALVRVCRSANVGYFVLGKGSNLLVSDAGLRGVVINLSTSCSTTELAETIVKAGAGVYIPKLVLECERVGLAGIEMFAGIPGTVGGALKMNAGCHGREMYDVVRSVDVLKEDAVVTLKKDEIDYAYRRVPTFDDETIVICGAALQLSEDDPGAIAERRKAYMKRRQMTQPINLPSSGSVFKNPPGDHAARLIEQCGLKGFRIGGAVVSDKHANFIVNEGGATALDVYDIIRHVRATVHRESGVVLELEVKLVGFTSDELNAVGQS